ncbi:TlpA family protein disulfide reductase [Chloroflexota bacterium]
MILLTVVAITLLFTGCGTGSTGTGVKEGDRAPDFQLQDLEGQTVSLIEQRGLPVLLNFWATWCGPCRYEMPFLQQIYQEWSDDGLVMMIVNIGESSSTVRDFLADNNLSLPVLLDTRQSVAEQYGITGIPTTFFIDKDGIIQKKVVGSFPSVSMIEDNLAEIIP